MKRKLQPCPQLTTFIHKYAINELCNIRILSSSHIVFDHLYLVIIHLDPSQFKQFQRIDKAVEFDNLLPTLRPRAALL